jgi:hypothetical protein
MFVVVEFIVGKYVDAVSANWPRGDVTKVCMWPSYTDSNKITNAVKKKMNRTPNGSPTAAA